MSQPVNYLRSFMLAPMDPLNLAVFRIVLFTVLFIYVDVDRLVWCASLPPEMRTVPQGLGWLLSSIPITESSVFIAAVLCRISCIGAAAGIGTNVFATVAFFTGFYALLVPQCFGKIDHGSNHLLLFAALLAVSPCGDALSLNNLLKPKSGNDEARPASWRYGLPIKVVWLTIAIAYFFSAVGKLMQKGLDWALSDNLRLIIMQRWAIGEPGYPPLVNIYDNPLLCKLGGLATLALELSFIVLICFPRTRRLAVIGGLLFHTATRAFMGISFWALQACYVCFIDWASLLGQKSTPQEFDGVKEKDRVMIATSAVILLGVAFAGATDQGVWPFARYPTFGYTAPVQRNILKMDVLDAQGRPVDVDIDVLMKRLYPYCRFGFTTRVFAIADPQARAQALAALLKTLQKQEPRLKHTCQVNFYNQGVTMLPSYSPNPPASSELLYRENVVENAN